MNIISVYILFVCLFFNSSDVKCDNQNEENNRNTFLLSWRTTELLTLCVHKMTNLTVFENLLQTSKMEGNLTEFFRSQCLIEDPLIRCVEQLYPKFFGQPLTHIEINERNLNIDLIKDIITYYCSDEGFRLSSYFNNIEYNCVEHHKSLFQSCFQITLKNDSFIQHNSNEINCAGIKIVQSCVTLNLRHLSICNGNEISTFINGLLEKIFDDNICKNISELTEGMVTTEGIVITEEIETTERIVTTTEICCPSPAILPEPGVCGVAPIYHTNIKETERETVLYEHPWLALLEYSYANNVKSYSSGGVLITQRYVLTASGCVHEISSTWTLTGVRLGKWNTQSLENCETNESVEQECSPPLDIKVIEIIKHEQYNPQSKNKENNIALLKLQMDVTFSDFIKPICLPKTEHLKSINHVGNTLFLSGWGYTDNGRESSAKLEVRQNIINSTRCQNRYNSYNVNVTISSTQICADKKIGVFCNVFCGSPLMTVDSTTGSPYWYLVGISSFDRYRCEPKPSVYTRASSYVNWIESKLNMD